MSAVSSAAARLGASSAAQQNLIKFSGIFLKWNQSINLSAARNEAELDGHVLDSLHVVPHLRAALAPAPTSPLRVLDVGTGGGLPAAIAAICLPDIQVTALEPVHKKHAFLRTVARELALTNFEPLARRLDDHPVFDYDVAMSRATFDLRDWLLLGLTHVHANGLVIGFEAVPRPDLPPGAARHPYALDDKSRAIITLSRPGP